ncbi:MAG: M3 family oligoendopeptidase, partial [Nitrosopumilaceae archaeon]
MPTFKQRKWNLSELVDYPDSPSFKKRLQEIESKVKKFGGNRQILNPNISEKKFLGILHTLEDISEKFSTISGYASLEYSADTQSDKATSLLTRMGKLGSEIENRTLFFDQWWKKQVDEKNSNRLMKNSGDLKEFLR